MTNAAFGRTKEIFEGLKIVDFGWVGAEPTVPMYFAHHGATVVRIETARRPDPLRSQGPYKDGISGINRAAGYDRTGYRVQHCIQWGVA